MALRRAYAEAIGTFVLVFGGVGAVAHRVLFAAAAPVAPAAEPARAVKA